MIPAGWFKVQSAANVDIEAGMIDDSAQLCVRNYQQAKYLPADFNSHVVAHATCVAGPATGEEAAVLNPNEVKITPPLAPVVTDPSVPVTTTPPPTTPGGVSLPGNACNVAFADCCKPSVTSPAALMCLQALVFNFNRELTGCQSLLCSASGC